MLCHLGFGVKIVFNCMLMVIHTHDRHFLITWVLISCHAIINWIMQLKLKKRKKYCHDFIDNICLFWVNIEFFFFFIVNIFILCSYDQYYHWRSSYQEGSNWIWLTRLTLQHFCACLKPGPGFPMLYVVVLFYFQWFEMRVLFILLILVELLTSTAV